MTDLPPVEQYFYFASAINPSLVLDVQQFDPYYDYRLIVNTREAYSLSQWWAPLASGVIRNAANGWVLTHKFVLELDDYVAGLAGQWMWVSSPPTPWTYTDALTISYQGYSTPGEVVIEDPSGGTSPGTQVALCAPDGGSNQQWQAVPAEDAFVYRSVVSQSGAGVLGAADWADGYAGHLAMQSQEYSPTQLWALLPDGRLQMLESGFLLTASPDWSSRDWSYPGVGPPRGCVKWHWGLQEWSWDDTTGQLLCDATTADGQTLALEAQDPSAGGAALASPVDTTLPSSQRWTIELECL